MGRTICIGTEFVCQLLMEYDKQLSSMDRHLPQGVVRRQRIKRWLIWSSIPIGIVIVLFLLRVMLQASVDRADIETSIVEVGPIEATVSARGVVVPEYEQVLTAPVTSTITHLYLNSGDTVEPGQPILKLDTDVLELRQTRLNDEIALQENQREQLNLELQRREIDLSAQYDVKELQTRYVRAQLERTRHLHELGGTTDEELARAQLNLEISLREKKQLSQSIENQKASLQAELDGLDLQIRIMRGDLTELQRELRLAEPTADRSGVITWINDELGTQVNSGEALVRVADLSSYRIEAEISDIHAGRLGVGGKVGIRLGDHRLRGKVSAVRPAVEGGIMTFIVSVDDSKHPALRPNLRADVYVVTSYEENVLRVKNGPFCTGAVDQAVFVINGEEAVRRSVDIGISNYDYIELKGDIAPGDEVIISDTRDYRHRQTIQLKGD